MESSVPKNKTAKRQVKPRPVKHTVTSLLRIVNANPLLKYRYEKSNGQISTIKDNLPMQKINLKRTQSVKEKPIYKINNKENDNLYTRQQQNASEKPSGNVKLHENICSRKLESVSPFKSTKRNDEMPNFSSIHKQTCVTIQPTKNEDVITFKTPNAYKRRSVAFFTPNTERKVAYTPYASTPGPDPSDLKRRLDKWLKTRGKSLGCYNHLKCFGLKYDTVTQNTENKENVEVQTDLSKGSYEDLSIIMENNDVLKPSVHTEEKLDLEVIAKEALKDLHKLILEDYPKEQCEAWLGTIRQKYKKLEEEPDYWECLAALEGAKGNITAAVDCYRTAIVQGAEVKAVDLSLEQLLQKFSLLNINTAEEEPNPGQKGDRKRVLLDARNAFKSTIIQFAMQERKLKNANLEKDKKIVVITPVRRSTRKSRTSFMNTPDMDIFSSIREARESVGEVTFHSNRSLAARFHNE